MAADRTAIEQHYDRFGFDVDDGHHGAGVAGLSGWAMTLVPARRWRPGPTA